MNKTITINIAGIIFNIEEDAYDTLKVYLDTIAGYFTTSEGNAEIMEDIEARIAELLTEKLPTPNAVVVLKDVDELIAIMGRPEEYIDDSESDSSSSTSSSQATDKKLYRDTDTKFVGGVCAGIAAYFGIKAIWPRLLFIACALGFWFLTGPLTALIYILLWIVVPEAKTTAEKLQMHGRPVTIETIKKKVDESLKDVSDDLGVDKGSLNNVRQGLSRGVDGLLDLIGRLVSLIGRIIGIALLISGILAITVLLSAALRPDFLMPTSLSFEQLLSGLFDTTLSKSFFLFGVSVQVFVPLLAITMIGILLAFRPKIKFRYWSAGLFVIWLVGLGLLIVTGIGLSKEFHQKGVVRTSEEVNIDTPSITVIGSLGENDDHFNIRLGSWLIDSDLFIDSNMVRGDDIDARISTANEGEPMSIVLSMSARGGSKEGAIDRAEQVVYDYRFTADSIVLSDHLLSPLADKFRGQEVDLTIKVPVGHTIYMDEGVCGLFRYIPTVEDRMYICDMVGKKWIMGPEGFYLKGSRATVATDGTLTEDSMLLSAPDTPDAP